MLLRRYAWRGRTASGSRGNGCFVGALVAVIVGPRNGDLVAGFRALDPQPEKGIARDRLAPLRIEHRFAVVHDDYVLNEVYRYDVALCVLALARFHRVSHEDANVRDVSVQRRP